LPFCLGSDDDGFALKDLRIQGDDLFNLLALFNNNVDRLALIADISNH
jgi:hypothetical protein